MTATADITDPPLRSSPPQFIINAKFLSVLLNPPRDMLPGLPDILVEASDEESTKSHASDSIDTEMTSIDESFDVEEYPPIPYSPDITTDNPQEERFHSHGHEHHGGDSLDVTLTAPAKLTLSEHPHSHTQEGTPNPPRSPHSPRSPRSPQAPRLPPRDHSPHHSPSPPLLDISPLKFSRAPRVKIAPLKRKDGEPELEEVFGTQLASKRAKTGFAAPVKKASMEGVQESGDTSKIVSETMGEAGMALEDIESPPDGHSAGSEQGRGDGSESSERREDRDERDSEQWKVGRLPGHQGSHTRSPRVNDTSVKAGHSSLKRSLSQVSAVPAVHTIRSAFTLTHTSRASPILPSAC